MPTIYYSSRAKDLYRGRLWRITTPEGKVSYLLGTMHIDHELLINGTPELNAIFNSCDRFTAEFPFEQTFAESFARLKNILQKDLPESLNSASELFKQQCAAQFENLALLAQKIIIKHYEKASEPNPYDLHSIKRLHIIVLLGVCDLLTKQENVCPVFDEQLILDAKSLQSKVAEQAGIRIRSMENAEFRLQFKIVLMQSLGPHQQLDFLIKWLSPPNIEKPVNYCANPMSILARLQYFIALLSYLRNKRSFYSNEDGYSQLDIEQYLARIDNPRNDQMFSQVWPDILNGDTLIMQGLLHCVDQSGTIALAKQNQCNVQVILETHNIDCFGASLKILNFISICCMALIALNNYDEKIKQEDINFERLCAVKSVYLLDAVLMLALHRDDDGILLAKYYLMAWFLLFAATNTIEFNSNQRAPIFLVIAQILQPFFHSCHSVHTAYQLHSTRFAGSTCMWQARVKELYDAKTGQPHIKRGMLTQFDAASRKNLTFVDINQSDAAQSCMTSPCYLAPA
jgi:uncharacterized protein YbaP (TraB family)